VLLYRGVLAVGMIVLGGIVLVRMLGFGVRLETLPGIVLGAAMLALGAHRISLIVRSRRGPAR
jgi:hypothetical protein